MKRFLYLLGMCVLLAGCAPKASDGAAPASPTTKTSETSANTEPKTLPAGNDEAPKPAVDPSMLPANLKHDGYEYYGLGNTKPMDVEVSSTPNGQVLTGSQTTILESIENGKALYRRERTGGLERLGVDEYSLEPTGVYVKSSTVAKTKGHDLEIPANLAPGTKWSDTTDIEMNGQTLKMNNIYKVVGMKPVKTKKGPFDALLITSTGKGIVGGKNVRMDSKSWYVKGVGNVRTEIKMVDAGGKVTTITYQVI